MGGGLRSNAMVKRRKRIKLRDNDRDVVEGIKEEIELLNFWRRKIMRLVFRFVSLR